MLGRRLTEDALDAVILPLAFFGRKMLDLCSVRPRGILVLLLLAVVLDVSGMSSLDRFWR